MYSKLSPKSSTKQLKSGQDVTDKRGIHPRQKEGNPERGFSNNSSKKDEGEQDSSHENGENT